jgi:hypothetical protein
MKSFTIPIRLSLIEAANLVYYLRQEGILVPSIGQAVKLATLAVLDVAELEFEEQEQDAAKAYLESTLGKKLPKLQKADLKKAIKQKKGDSFIKEEPNDQELYIEPED